MQQSDLKLFIVDFEGMYPVGSTLVLLAKDLEEASEIARETITHTDKFEIKEVDQLESGVVVYLNGDY